MLNPGAAACVEEVNKIRSIINEFSDDTSVSVLTQ